jgi:hypothetical protein
MACQAVEAAVSGKDESLTHRVSTSYQHLSAAATELNTLSDELGKFVQAVDGALKKLNLGIASWIRLEGREDGSGNYSKRDLGYAKVGNRWGIALRAFNGNHNNPDESTVEEWLFNDAPRALRIEAVEKLPDLFEHLGKEAESAAKQIKTKTERARQLATALGDIGAPAPGAPAPSPFPYKPFE